MHIEQAVRATISLVLPHRAIRLPETPIEALQTVAIDVGKALLENGEKAEQTGAAIVEVADGAAGSVNAYAHVLDLTKSLSFSFPFLQSSPSEATPLDAVAWYFNKQTDGFIAMQNTTDSPVVVVPTLLFSGKRVNLGTKRLQAHEAVTIQLPRLGNKGPDGQQAVGVRVEHNGQPGSVLAQGWVMDEAIGFSTPFTF